MINLEAYAALPIIEQIDTLHQQIDSLRPISPEQEQRILQKYRLDWNYHSNAIEGNSLTYGETRAFLMHGLTAKGKPLKDHLDIRGHNQAVDFIYRMIKEETEITETDIRSLHEVILVEPYEVDTKTDEGIPAKKRIQLGRYKTSPNHVETKTGEIHYYATPEDTPILMGELMEVYRQNKTNPAVHPFILAAYFHYRFTAIHPFDDGNGRMARLMMNLLLMKAGYPPVIIRQEKASREAYYYALSQADAGEYIPFFELIGEALVHSMKLYVKGAKGESLEEPDDLDKELALLKRELETSGKIQVIKSLESKYEAYKKSMVPLINDIERLFLKFKDFFLESKEEIFLISQNKSGFIHKQINISSLNNENSTNNPLLTDLDIFILEVNYNFNYFRNIDYPFSVSWIVALTFNNLEYEISLASRLISPDKSLSDETLEHFSSSDYFNPSSIEIKKTYHSFFTDDEIKELSKKVGKSFIEGVKKLIIAYPKILKFEEDNKLPF